MEWHETGPWNEVPGHIKVAWRPVISEGLKTAAVEFRIRDGKTERFETHAVTVEKYEIVARVHEGNFHTFVPEGEVAWFRPSQHEGFALLTGDLPGFKLTRGEEFYYIYLNPSSEGDSPDSFLYGGENLDPGEDDPQVFLNVNVPRLDEDEPDLSGLYIFVSYEGTGACIKHFSSEEEAVEAFTDWALAESSAHAALFDAHGRALAGCADGEISTSED